MKRIFQLTLMSFILIFTGSGFVTGKINFQSSVAEKIELESLPVSREAFLSYIEEVILAKPFGLGNYGRVSFYPCNFEINGMKLIDYKTMEGKEVRFLTNPSCHQVVLRRVLEEGYQYQRSNLSGYENRRCILAVEKIISPILEYYTIRYEERQDSACSSCEVKEQDRLSKILSVQRLVTKSCKGETQKVMKFINELDSTVEKTYQKKNGQH